MSILYSFSLARVSHGRPIVTIKYPNIESSSASEMKGN